MKKNLSLKIILILLFTTACLFVSFGFPLFGKTFDLKLGLDLSGGSHLVFEADTSKLEESKKAQAIKSLRNVIEKRVNLFGLSEPNVQTSRFEGKDRIIVELPGVNDPKQAAESIGQTAQLVFMEVQETSSEDDATPSASLVPTGLTGAKISP